MIDKNIQKKNIDIPLKALSWRDFEKIYAIKSITIINWKELMKIISSVIKIMSKFGVSATKDRSEKFITSSTTVLVKLTIKFAIANLIKITITAAIML